MAFGINCVFLFSRVCADQSDDVSRLVIGGNKRITVGPSIKRANKNTFNLFFCLLLLIVTREAEGNRKNTKKTSANVQKKAEK